MTEKIKSLLVLGLGKVGSMVAALLQETGFEVIGADMNDTDGMTFPVKKFNIINSSDYKIISEYDAVISCLPYHFNIGLAAAAHELGVHYFDLTEDVKTTKAITAPWRTGLTVS
jgi:saccharopine dehydrogenase-like NADP-dependent oxidoreductase